MSSPRATFEPIQVKKYISKTSDPLLNRIDIHVEVSDLES
ncbi:MAG: ATP-binding protein [Nitrospinales bacterium]